jgi:hypothetical protein
MNRHQVNSLFDLLPEISKHAVGFTLLCFISGFAIANLYLGSLGVVNLDILRTRYILVGLLFLVFIGALVFLVSGLLEKLRSNFEKSPIKIIYSVASFSLQKFIIIYLVISAIAVFAGSLSSPPVGIPRIASVLSIFDWWATTSINIGKVTAWLTALIFATVFIVALFLIAVNPKDKFGEREPRSKILKDIFLGMKQNPLGLIGFIVGIYVVMFLFLMLSSLLTFMTTTSVGSTSKTSILLSEGWIRYMGGIVIVYCLIAICMTLTVLNIRSKSKNETKKEIQPIEKISSWIFLIALAILIIVPVYALGVYPKIPMQIGGGEVLQVEVIISSEEVKNKIINSECEIYLLDRTSTSTLFLVVQKNTLDYRVAEVSNSLIEAITYDIAP